MLYDVVVETTDSSNQPELFRVLTLSQTELGAKRSAGKAVLNVVGREYRIVDALVLDPFKPHVISVVRVDDELYEEAPR